MTDEGGYGRFGALSRQELERYCYLDDEDRRLIAARRRDYNRLGFAVQVVTVRHLGMFLADPLDVPPALIEYLAEQLEISDPSMVKRYTDREKTKLEHAWEIQQVYGLKPFGEMESELTSWIVDQAWMTGDGPKAIFGDAVTWLRKRQALLPGITTLERLIGDGRNAADARLWRQLGEQLTSESASALLRLLEVPAEGGQKVSELERLRKGVFKASSKGMLAALRRVVDLQAVGVDSIDVRAIPPRRLTGLATYGLASKAAALRRLPTREQRLAVLAATVVVLSARAVDDVLETFDMLMTTKLLSKAERESREEKLRRYPRVSRNAGKLAAAVKVLLEMVEVNQDVGLGVVLDMIEKTVTRAELRHAVQAVDELVPADDAELDGQRLIELAGKFATVRPFLSMLMDTIEFGATSDGAAVLAAMKTLAELLTSRSSGKIPANLLDARKVDHDLIVGAWKRLIYTPGRPEGTVDRNSYTICVLEQFHRHLKHRSIFAVRSSRWRDPRAHLLAGEAWEAARDAGMNALGLPAAPTQLLTDHATALETAYRELAARLGEDTPASIDADGKLHVAALDAKAEPASLVDLRRRVEAMIPRVDLPELVTEVMSWHPGFTEAFTHTSGNEARVADLGLSVAAVLCSYAMNVGFKPVTTPGVDALTRDRLLHVDQCYVRAETIEAANAVLVDAQADIPLAQAWGGGLVASVDGMRFVVPVRTHNARPNPKYFGRKLGITWLNMLNDQSAGLAGKVLRGTPRDSLHTIDVIVSQHGGRIPEVIITDTGSYSDIVFGLLHLIGRQYRPQLANLPDQRLWRIDARADYGPLDKAARGVIDTAKIAAHWEDMCRIAVSIHSGEVSAHEVTRMISRDGQPTALGQAIAHFGRIFKTLHILRLADDEPYRREGKAQSNLVEGRHDLARTIYHGRKGEMTRAYYEGMEDQLSALGLVLNCVVVWNTVYENRALAALRAGGYPVLDTDVERLSAFVRAHIGIDGHYSFHLPDPSGVHRPLRDPDADDDE
ncbi:Tn3 family transposase [Rhodococcus sp. D-46]|uniref:Transposase n=21 Tax=cellular organisms TaxID=131567 RepID=A0A172UHU0_9MYCO|nr:MULTISPECIES: Tn3 family transposase [Mycobacteriales]MBP6571068.1 Tn3 family transposase [Gemmatimonadales bacterium]MCF6389962.1 Tn3 family transposase [Mycobacterium sp. MBM]MDZ4269372.1 Tn3 family transposase [Mycobacterium sp.]MDZ7931916.1 Tn3 family transposase [Rhodococcus sp. (in: high G+C Gram-positive bacteria)]NHE68998.1 Tn3 family transposase [Rhodococcus sp. D-46]PZT90923.1 MAG: Tn3 family transposase [Gordonia sp. (in: high G+C Gram-positive bacteria)]